MPKRQAYYAGPTPAAAHHIRQRFGYVPGPLYVNKVHWKTRSGPFRFCFNCHNRIGPRDPYTIVHRVSPQRIDIALCHRCIEGNSNPYGGMPWPGLEEATSGDPGAGLPKPVEKPRDTAVRARGMVSNREAREELLARLVDQGWRCAYPCEGNGKGRPLLPGEKLAVAYDGHGLVHLDCAVYAEVPTEENPWAKEFTNGREEA